MAQGAAAFQRVGLAAAAVYEYQDAFESDWGAFRPLQLSDPAKGPPAVMLPLRFAMPPLPIVAAASDQRFAPVQGGQRANAAWSAGLVCRLGISNIVACQ